MLRWPQHPIHVPTDSDLYQAVSEQIPETLPPGDPTGEVITTQSQIDSLDPPLPGPTGGTSFLGMNLLCSALHAGNPDATLPTKSSSGKDLEYPVDCGTTVVDRIPVPLRGSRVTVQIDLDQRRKGLLWYDTYGVAFAAHYRLQNSDAGKQTVFVHFPFPSAEALYDDFRFSVNGTPVAASTDLTQGLIATVALPAGAEADVEVGYRSRGLGEWTYAFAGQGVARVGAAQAHLQHLGVVRRQLAVADHRLGLRVDQQRLAHRDRDVLGHLGERRGVGARQQVAAVGLHRRGHLAAPQQRQHTP